MWWLKLCCEEGSALSKACSKVSEITYFGVTKEVDLLSYNGLCLLREVFGVLTEGDVKVLRSLVYSVLCWVWFEAPAV